MLKMSMRSKRKRNFLYKSLISSGVFFSKKRKRLGYFAMRRFFLWKIEFERFEVYELSILVRFFLESRFESLRVMIDLLIVELSKKLSEQFYVSHIAILLRCSFEKSKREFRLL